MCVMSDHPPCSTLNTGGNPSHREEVKSNDNHKGFPQEPPPAELLHPSVRHLVERRPYRSRSWRTPGHPGGNRRAYAVRDPGDARRSHRGRHPVDRPLLRKGGPSSVAIPVAQVAGWCSLVRHSAPYRPALVHGGTLAAFADLLDISPR